jgi:hypothetical protein
MHEPSDGIAEEVERQLQLALAASDEPGNEEVSTLNQV